MNAREPIVTLTEKDFRWDYFRGSGKGGQKRNKTSSAVRCTHQPSGVSHYSDATRSQHRNKIDAFSKVARDKVFVKWLRLEHYRRTGKLLQIEEEVDRQMKSVKVELRQDDQWVDERDITGSLLQ